MATQTVVLTDFYAAKWVRLSQYDRLRFTIFAFCSDSANKSVFLPYVFCTRRFAPFGIHIIGAEFTLAATTRLVVTEV
jgi:hypothetical protein